MLFNSIEFLFLFLPTTVLGFYLLQRGGSVWAVRWLVSASLFFYAWWHPPLLLLLLGSATFNYLIARLLEKHRHRLVLSVGVLANLLLLGTYKYATFIADNAAWLFGADIAAPDIVLPLAISFFTFQQIAYLVDVYRNYPAEKSAWRYLLFVSFFPQLIAGPIVHHTEMMPQFNHLTRALDAWLLAPAITLITLGLAKKVLLADTLLVVADPGFAMASQGLPLNGLEAITSATAYSLQLYFDFSGYCDIAMGCALLFGIRLPINFESPLKATSIIDFWHRWHITLSRFLRDYLYIPLGGNRHGTPRRFGNLLITMLLGGLWHGAAWNFVLWGGLHGVFLMLNHGWRHVSNARFANDPRLLVRLPSGVLTFVCVVSAFVYFRAPDVATANRLLQSIPDNMAWSLGDHYKKAVSESLNGDLLGLLTHGFGADLFIGGIMAGTLGTALLLPNSLSIISQTSADISTQPPRGQRSVIALRWRSNTLWAILIAGLMVAVCLSLSQVSPFLYFQF